jgi:transposase InsO family protein
MSDWTNPLENTPPSTEPRSSDGSSARWPTAPSDFRGVRGAEGVARGPAHPPAQQNPPAQALQRGDMEAPAEDAYDEFDEVPDVEEFDAAPKAANRPLAPRPRTVPSGSAQGLESALNAIGAPRRRQVRRARTVPAADARRPRMSANQRMLLLDTWRRSGLSASDFAAMVGVSAHTLYKWSQNFAAHGPAGLEDGTRTTKGQSRLPEPTRRAILLLKQTHPDWGQERIHDALRRSEGFTASPGAIGRVLEQAGYVTVQVPTRPHPDKPRRFERARPNELWQTDLFTFVLKRENRRVYMVVFMDDHSRFIVGWALAATSTGELVREAFESSVANFGLVQEVLTDNGPQYHTWRGKSAFTKLLERRGVRQIVARPRRPQTLGKVERFWQTLWRECLESAIFRGLDDARRRIGHFIGYYNFQRTHSSLEGLVPADRFFEASKDVRATLAAQVAQNALELARDGEPRKPFYLTGRVGNETISLHAEGERVVLVRENGTREEVDLGASGPRIDTSEKAPEARPSNCSETNDTTGGGFYEESFAGPVHHEDDQHYDEQNDHKDEDGPHDIPAPGTSPLDAALQDLARNWSESEPFCARDSEHSKDDEIGDAYGDGADGDAAGNPAGGRP